MAIREVVAGVVDNMVRAERSDQIDFGGAADASDLSTEDFRDLDGEAAHTARCTNAHHPVSRSDVRLADGLQRGACRDRDSCGLLEGQVRWLARNHARP